MSKATSLTVQHSAKPSEVRTWLRANGLLTTQARGKFSKAQIDAYNAANAVKYRPAKFVPTKPVKVKDGRNRTVTRKINPAQAREVLLAHHYPVGQRGRLTAEQYQKAYDLSLASV